MITDNITGRQTQSKQPQQSQRRPQAAPDTKGWNWGTLLTNGASPSGFGALRVVLYLL